MQNQIKNHGGKIGILNYSDPNAYVNGIKVVGTQIAYIADPSGGSTQDAEARTAINAILDLLESHGLMAYM